MSRKREQEKRLRNQIEAWVNQMIRVTRIEEWGNELGELLFDWANEYGVIFTTESVLALQRWIAHEQELARQELAREERELAEGRRFHAAIQEAAEAEEQGIETEHGTRYFWQDSETGQFMIWEVPRVGGKASVVSKPAVKAVTKAIIARLARKRLLQAHHIFPKKLFDPSTALGKWLSRLVAKSAKVKLIFLPTLKSGGKQLAQRAARRLAEAKPVSAARKALAAYAKRTGHQGRHLSAYTKDLKIRLKAIMTRHQAGTIDDVVAKAETAALQAELREGLESGYIILQKAELATLKAGGYLAVGALGVAVPMAQADWDKKVKEFEAYVETIIEPRFMKGMRVEDHFPEAKILDWLNPLDFYASMEELGYALSLKGDPDEILRAKMDELGLLPPPEVVVHVRKVTAMLERVREQNRWPPRDEQDYIDRCLKRSDFDIATVRRNGKIFFVVQGKVGEKWYSQEAGPFNPK